ncbi:MAG: GNAT family N-acetyltransferase [Candidatus Cloacimonadota bacterium]|nr:GNAT family N-acetyltransferase [Candidatus Cloacimonadota bacterium]
MLNIEKITNANQFTKNTKEEFINFLYTHLDKFGDPKEDIQKCIDYAFSDNPEKGGFVLAAYVQDTLVGGLIMNNTGMSGYIPENILVYIAVDQKFRGKGYGGKIIERSFQETKGNIKLHVEYDNPAKRLYERIGFKTKYAEMRYEKK